MACVLVTEIMDPSGTSIIKDAGHDVIEGWTLSADELGARYPDIDAIMVRTNKIPADMMAQMPNLKIVSKHGVGCDNIDVTYARANNIAVAIAVDANADSVAEHTLMFMLMLAKNPREMDRVVREDYSLRKATKAVDIGARTVLVVGYGRIGTRVARLCATFGMTVLIHDTKFTGAETKIDGYEVAHDIDEALALVGLTHLQNQSALKLSAGERQRLSLARAKCQRPKMILLDEPTSHLDIGHQVALLNTLVQQSNACEQTMIASMHDIGLIQRGFTHALLLMNDGSYLAGSLSEVINPTNLERALGHPISTAQTAVGQTIYIPA